MYIYTYIQEIKMYISNCSVDMNGQTTKVNAFQAKV